MNILYLLIILILLVIYNLKSIKENFVDNMFYYVVKSNYKPNENDLYSKPKKLENIQYLEKPDYLPHKVNNYYYYYGKLTLHPYNKYLEAYLYGKPIEAIHKLYSYYVVFIENKKIKYSFYLNPHKKFNLGDPIFVRDGPNKEGPYFLE